MAEILSSVSCTLLVSLASEVPFCLQIARSLDFLYLFYFHFQDLNDFVHLLPLFIYAFIDFFKWFLNFLFKDIYHIDKCYFYGFYFVLQLWACCDRIAGL